MTVLKRSALIAVVAAGVLLLAMLASGLVSGAAPAAPAAADAAPARAAVAHVRRMEALEDPLEFGMRDTGPLVGDRRGGGRAGDPELHTDLAAIRRDPQCVVEDVGQQLPQAELVAVDGRLVEPHDPD